ncbi:MAG: MauE/DoxX family redox-associated membrane protein [Microthrixaceae bacterium]
MTLLDAAYWVACVVLVVSGATKLFDPTATESTLRELGLPAPRSVGRVLGAAEILLGAGGLLATPGTIAQATAVFVALIYALFALVVVAAYRRGLQDCGCLGVRSRAPTPGHAVLNVGFAAVAAASAAVGPVDLSGGLGSLSVGAAVAVGALVAVLGGLVVARV